MAVKNDATKAMRMIAAYTQAVCTVSEKDHFRMDLGYYLSAIPKDESLIIDADLKGNVG